MSRIISHIPNHLIYTADDSVIVPVHERAVMNRLIRKFCRKIDKIPENIIGFLCLGTIICVDNPRKLCPRRKACAEVGNCEKDKKRGSVHYAAYNYVAKSCRRQKIASGNFIYFKDLFGYQIRYLVNTPDGSAFVNYYYKVVAPKKSAEDGKRE